MSRAATTIWSPHVFARSVAKRSGTKALSKEPAPPEHSCVRVAALEVPRGRLDDASPEQLLQSRHHPYGAELSCLDLLGRLQQQRGPRFRPALTLALHRGAHGPIPRNASYKRVGDFPESPDPLATPPPPPAAAVRCAAFLRTAAAGLALIAKGCPAVRALASAARASSSERA